MVLGATAGLSPSRLPIPRQVVGLPLAHDFRMKNGASGRMLRLLGMLKLRLYVGCVKTHVLHIVVHILNARDSVTICVTASCMLNFPVKLRI
jgi:hypothetical protein